MKTPFTTAAATSKSTHFHRPFGGHDCHAACDDLVCLAAQVAEESGPPLRACLAWVNATADPSDLFILAAATHPEDASDLRRILVSLHAPQGDLHAAASFSKSSLDAALGSPRAPHFLASTPIFRDGQFVGVLIIYGHSPCTLSARATMGLERLARQAAFLQRLAAPEAHAAHLIDMLQHARERLEAVGSHTREGVWTLDDLGETQYVNDTLCEMLGYTRDELMGRALTDFVDIAEHEFHLKEPRGITGAVDADVRFRCADGTRRWTRLSLTNVRDGDNRVIGTVALVADIHERKIYEKALAESERRFRTFMDNSPACVFLKDEEGRCVYVNKAWHDVLGHRPEQVLGRPETELYPPEIHAALSAHDRYVLESNSLLKAIETIPRVDGTLTQWLVYKFPFEESSGRRLIAGVAIEITDLKETEARLQSERDFSANVLNTVGCLVIVLDAGGRVIRTNRAFEHLTGLQEDAAGGRNFWELECLFEEDTLRIAESFRTGEVLQTRAPLAGIDVRSAAGDRRHIVWNTTVMRNEAGEPTHIIHAGIDETESRRAKLTAEEARVQAERANRAKTEFLANMSHEIRTPMTAILGHIDILDESGFGRGSDALSIHERRHSLRTVRRNAEHLLQLISDVLDLSKIEAGRLDVESIPCSPLQIISDVASVMRIRAVEKKIAFQVQYIGPVPNTIHTDPTRLRQILLNLLGNALKFTSMGSVRLLVRLLNHNSLTEKPQLQFQVVDTGIGMTQQQIAMLFKPFAQADSSTTRKYGGTGLGLSISKRLAEAMGGGICVDSIPNAGTTLTVWIDPGALRGSQLIIDPGEAEAAFPTGTRLEPAHSFAKVLTGKRILLAEDGPDNQYLIAMLLRRAGAKVTAADNGRSAVAMTLDAVHEQRPFDLVLMDMQMPEVDGYVATRRLRERGYTGKIIALTAHTMPGDRERCLAEGCDDYIPKPFEPTRLIEAVVQAVGSAEQQQLLSDSGVLGSEQFQQDPEYSALCERFAESLREIADKFEHSLGAGAMAVIAEQTAYLKGTAGMYGFAAISRAASLVDRGVRAGLQPSHLSRAVEDLVYLCRDAVRASAGRHRGAGKFPAQQVQAQAEPHRDATS